MATKVVIESTNLRGSRDERFPQKVATVYIDGGQEFNVMAPSKATGDALEWREHISVRKRAPSGWNSITDGPFDSIIQHVVGELERRKLHSDIWTMGTNEDGRFCAAQICLRGHVQNANGNDFQRGEFCSKCGDPFIDACPNCEVAIRGNGTYETGHYSLPYYCHKCGRPYPWMADRLNTAKELLYHDDKLSEEDRRSLWGLLQYVMSDPKSDLVPAKRKLIEIGLGKATTATREFVENIIAKYAAEMSKP